jgi:hypothetical protein
VDLNLWYEGAKAEKDTIMLESIAIHESLKGTLALINLGYRQSAQGVYCPLCGEKYLLLLDKDSYQPRFGIGIDVQRTALDYLSEVLRVSTTLAIRKNN